MDVCVFNHVETGGQTWEFLPLLLAADVGVEGVEALPDESLDFLLGGLSLSLSLSLSSVGVPFLFVGVDELLLDSNWIEKMVESNDWKY